MQAINIQTNQLERYALPFFLILFCFAYLWGMLSPAHYPLSQLDLYIGFYSVIFVSLGLLGWFVLGRTQSLSLSSGLWFGLAALILLQPILNTISYMDALIFPVAMLLVAGLVAIVAANLNDKEKSIALTCIAITLVLTGLLLTVTQFLQVFYPTQLPFWVPSGIVFPISKENPRVYSNLAQPNQTACVLTLAVVSVIYLFNGYPSNSKVRLWSGSVQKLGSVLVMLILAIGISMTASRASLFLVVATLVGIGFYRWRSLRALLVYLAVFILVMVAAYFIGTAILNNYLPRPDVVSSIDRLMHEESLNGRMSLLKQAWLAFSQNWLTGIGWGNFSQFGIQHAKEIEWLSNANHAHNLIAQIAAELGILGLLLLFGFLGVLAKVTPKFLTRAMPSHETYCYMLLVIIGLYSLSEYPLWYAKFLLLTAFLVGVLDTNKIKIAWSKGVNGLVIGFLSMVVVASSFYAIRYDDYLRVFVRVNAFTDYQDSIAEFKTLPTVFGYSNYRELIQFFILLDDDNSLDERIALGYRVLNTNSAAIFIEKQAILLAMAGRQKEADQLFLALCQMEHSQDCKGVIELINDRQVEDGAGYIKRLQLQHP